MSVSHLSVRRLGAAAGAALTLALAGCGSADPAASDDPTTAPAAVAETSSATPTASAGPTEAVTTGNPTAGEAARACPLLDEGEISAAIGHDVVFREDYSQAAGIEGVCAYTSSDESVQVTVMAIAASFADETIQEMQDAATALTGNAAEPIEVGDDGYAFGHDSGGEAATVAGDLLLDVQVMSTSGPGQEIGNKMDAAVSLLERLMASTA